MKKLIFPMVVSCLLNGAASAQDDIPMLSPEERKAVESQSDEFNDALRPALAEAAKSTVRVWSGKRRLGYGTAIDANKVITKWSEIVRHENNLTIQSAAGEAMPASIAGVYEEEDLAVLETTGSALIPVRWSDKKPALGSFLATPQPDGRPAGFGVVSVLERDLRETNQAFLGIQGDFKFEGPGVRIEEVTRESGAAAAGLKPGDIILKVGDRPISGVLELRNSLIGVSPGTRIAVIARVNGKERTFDVLLGNRPKLGGFQGDRLRAMERMGGRVSMVRDSFPNAIQTDMRLRTDQIGGPVVNLDGDVVGITIARADRTRSFVMSATGLRELLKKPGLDPSIAKVREEENPAMSVRGRIVPPPGPGRMMPGNPERMRQHLSEMQRLMDFMREEMESLEEPADR
jgi:serine protease Do